MLIIFGNDRAIKSFFKKWKESPASGGNVAKPFVGKKKVRICVSQVLWHLRLFEEKES
jgi:hypothetical protein